MNILFLIPAIIGVGAAFLGAWLGSVINNNKIRKIGFYREKLENTEEIFLNLWASLENFRSEANSKFEEHKNQESEIQESTLHLTQKINHLEKQLIQLKDMYKISNIPPFPPNKKEANVQKNSNDDLKKLKGIGPGIEKLLIQAGVDSWAKLAEMDEASLKRILENGKIGKFVAIDTWPRQAYLAQHGQWKALEKMQKELGVGANHKP